MAHSTNLQKIHKTDTIVHNHEISGGLHLAEPGLTAGSLADEIWARFQMLKACNIQFPLCLAKLLHCFSKFNAFPKLFSGKHYHKVAL